MQFTKSYKLGGKAGFNGKDKKLEGILLSKDYSFNKTDVKSPYELARYVGSIGNVVVYTSGKVVLQMSVENTSLVSGIEGLSDSRNTKGDTYTSTFLPHVGVDEVGKGDYFGPLVAVAIYLDMDGYDVAKKLGVDDSKKMTDGRILEIAPELMEVTVFDHSVVMPKDYNTLNAKVKNASIVLAIQHGKVIEGVLGKLNLDDKVTVVIDQFSKRKDRVLNELGPLGKKAEVVQFHKGESDIAVAVASVIARAIFLAHWEKMEIDYGIRFPKGATNVIGTGKRFVKVHGKEVLGDVAKISFRTTKQVLG